LGTVAIHNKAHKQVGFLLILQTIVIAQMLSIGELSFLPAHQHVKAILCHSK